MTIKRAYQEVAKSHGFTADKDQDRVVARLDELQHRILARDSLIDRLRRVFAGGERKVPLRGIYLWGGVGRGKTFLLDLFFNSLNVPRKKRIHFHRMMSDVHARLKSIRDTEDPLDRVAADIAAETAVLCFDEFFVSDIGDAMILGRLLDGLFRRGVVLVATSNVPPRDLYRDGLQRQRFEAAINALENHTDVIELDGGIDYRLQLFSEAGTYLAPADEASNRSLQHYFEEIASAEILEDHVVEVLGREIRARRCAKGIVWFDFADICEGPRSQEDYIEIARWYPTVIISDVPRFGKSSDDAARRFIALVDEFYDRKVKLVLSAATGPDELYAGRRLGFEFERTASRLREMQSDEYLHAPHLA